MINELDIVLDDPQELTMRILRLPPGEWREALNLLVKHREHVIFGWTLNTSADGRCSLDIRTYAGDVYKAEHYVPSMVCVPEMRHL